MRALPVGTAFHRHLAFSPEHGRDHGHGPGQGPVREGIACTRRTLAAWFPHANPGFGADVLLVAAELLANAAEHAGGPLTLGLRVTPSGRIRISVTDASAAVPQMRPLMPHTPGGHGMRIIDRLARAWGTHPVPGGKAVWAECAPPPTTLRAL